MDTRIEDLISRINESYWPDLFPNRDGGVPSLGIQPYQWWSEALHGVGTAPAVKFAPPTPNATSFPQVILTAASFNKSLFKAIGEAIGTEGRAMANAQHAGLTFWTPNINIFR